MTSAIQKPLRLGLFEVRLLFRRKITAVSAAIMPLGLCVLTWFNDRDTPDQEWGPLLGQRFVMLMLLSVFMVCITVYTARRQSRVLKRLRTTELTDTGLMSAITVPVVVLGLGQVAVYFGFSMAVGAPLPENPLLVVVGVVLGILLTVAAGLATAALSKTAEATQITSFPVLVLALAGIFLVTAPTPAVALTGVGMPLIGPGELVTQGWSGTGAGVQVNTLPGPLPGLLSTLLWAVVFAAVIARYFRFEPRS